MYTIKNIFKNHFSRLFLISSLILICATSCNRPGEGSIKDGLHITNTVQAVVETDPVPQKKNEDSADDPAIWIDLSNPENSVIIGTDKKGGLVTYDLAGKQLNYYYTGDMNNCDLRYGFPLNGDTIDILAATNRTYHSISLFKIKEGGKLDTIHSRVIHSEMTDEVYGLCMFKSPETEKFYVFINSKAGEVEQWELLSKGEQIDAKLIRSFTLGTQTEGMVADDEKGILYIGEELAGIWRFNAEPDGSNQGIQLENSSEENPNIKYDIEGITIYKTDSVNGYLIASSQGNYSYAVFERQESNKYLGSFRIIDAEIDAVEETDGIDITNVSLPGFPKGFLVVQDGYNYDGKKKMSQNFKIIPGEEIEAIFN
ncbi:MAG: phytase [Prolixibacteraceae bacterium]|nr:phytase [Prolixibacteraceae bacterium]